MEKKITCRYPLYHYLLVLSLYILFFVIRIYRDEDVLSGLIFASCIGIPVLFIFLQKYRISSGGKLINRSIQLEIRHISRIVQGKHSVKVFYLSPYTQKEAKYTFYPKDKTDFITSLLCIKPEIKVER